MAPTNAAPSVLEDAPPSQPGTAEADADGETSSAARDVVFIHSPAYYRALSRLPVHPRREQMTLELLQALATRHTGTERDECRPFGMQFIAPSLATDDHLMRFHARDYVDTLRRTAQSGAATSKPTMLGDSSRTGTSHHGRPVSDRDCKEFDLVDDAYVFPGLYEYCRYVAGASLTAADALKHLIGQWRQRSQEQTACRPSAPVVINLGGGRHHAMRSQASGFCYINDVVLAIQRLLQAPPATTDNGNGNDQHKLERVLCIDMDVHHGDGVQEAFFYSANATTLSFHMMERAFFPGTGAEDEIGGGRGKYHTINVPLRRGIVDGQFHALFETIVAKAIECVDPEAVVLLCGVDTLARDNLGGFNLTSHGITQCVKTLMAFNRPTLLLGGGGYSGSDACRALAAVVTTVAAPNVDVHNLEVPEHEFFEEYESFC
jgi:histone deacetylase 8